MSGLLESHRGEVTVVFCDLRGFTAFAEIAEPEEVMAVLREYHADAGRDRTIRRHSRTLCRRRTPSPIQRSAAVSRSVGTGRANGGADA